MVAPGVLAHPPRPLDVDAARLHSAGVMTFNALRAVVLAGPHVRLMGSAGSATSASARGQDGLRGGRARRGEAPLAKEPWRHPYRLDCVGRRG
jgi:hypothetical protein